MIEGFLDFLQDLLPSSWFEDLHTHYNGLTDDEIAQSVHEASTFFNMDDPVAIQESWTTGVFTNMDVTPDDDVLVFSRDQMHEMGITDKEGFDLVMTHEGAHRMLQGLHDKTGFGSHQEELCCDYMAGVRAGLNNMDITKMQASLADSPESDTHPAGTDRVEAIKEGVEFAHNYMKKHGKAPTFSDCLEHFEQTELAQHDAGQVTLSPEMAAYAESEKEDAPETSESTLKAYSKDEINRKLAHAESEKRRYEGLVEHHKYMAKHGLDNADTNYHLNQASNFQKRANECAAEANKWRYTKPDKK